MAAELNTNIPSVEVDDEEEMEIVVEVVEDQMVALTAGEWGIRLSAEEARMLGEVLLDAAEDAASGEE
jgi:hypothetical protein